MLLRKMPKQKMYMKTKTQMLTKINNVKSYCHFLEGIISYYYIIIIK